MTHLESDILNLIHKRDHVSFAELIGLAGDRARGQSAVEISGTNIVLWKGLSEELADAVISLMLNRRIIPVPCSVLVYMVDGIMLRMPIAKRPPKNGYKEPRWAPVVFRPAERVM